MSDEALRVAAQAASRSQPNKEVFSFEHGGERFWLKRARPTGSNALHHLAWRVTKLPLLVPVKRQSAKEALLHESQKILRLGKRGLSVPSVPLVTQNYFVLGDSGPSMQGALKHGLIEEPEAAYRELFSLLGRLHSLGEYHGGSQVRNFTYKERRLGLIDFEENFPDEIELATLQFRDIFLLLFSLVKDRHPLQYAPLLELYEESSGNDWVVDELKAFGKRLKTLESIVRFGPIWKVLDKDTKATWRLLQEIKKL